MKIIDLGGQSGERWLAWRREGVCASDIAAIMGVCPYKSALDIYNDKKCLSVDTITPAMQRGKDYENEAREAYIEFHRYTERHGPNFKGPPFDSICCEDDDNPHYKASLDGYNYDLGVVLEIKCPGRITIELAKKGQVPRNYYYQIQWQLMITGAHSADYWCYDIDNKEGYCVCVFPNGPLMDEMKNEADYFWNTVIINQPPVNRKDKEYQFDPDVKSILKEMFWIKSEMKRLTDMYDHYAAELFNVHKIEKSIEIDEVSFVRSERSSIDYKKAAEDAGIDLEKYRKPVSIVWTLKGKKDD